MSYWVYVYAETTDGRAVEVYDKNVTYNVCGMFYGPSMPEGLRGLHDMKAGDAKNALRFTLDRMLADPETYKAMEPDNGWGSYDGACEFLCGLIVACAENPRGKVVVS